MKSRLLILFSLLKFFHSFSQTPAELENKYWNYRDRLQKYFVQIGPGAGQSIPAASIYTHGNNSDTFRIVNGQEEIITLPQRNSYNGKIGFGDATLDQGWYIAVLASEYWLLKHKGLQNTDRFKALCNELYFALAAVDRVDNNAEPYLKYDEQQTKNGFFIRSDHAADFLKYFRESQISYQPIENLASGGTAGPEILFRDTTNGTLKVYDPDSFRINLAAKNNAGLLDDNNRVQFPGGPGQYGSAQNLGK